MAKGKRKAAATEPTETVGVPDTRAREPGDDSFAGETGGPVSEFTTGVTTENSADDPPPREQFRSWVDDSLAGYARLTDDVNRLLVLKFDEKPRQEVLVAIKQAGFQFRPDHFGQKSVWVRRNDAQGRLILESIEKLVRGDLVERQQAIR